MTKELEKLSKLEKARTITIGVDRNHVNIFWSRTTRVGKITNSLTVVLLFLSIYIFIRNGIKAGVLALLFIGFYTVLIQKMAGWHVRARFLREEELFDAAYETRSATIRDNGTGEIIRFPTDWRTWLKGK